MSKPILGANFFGDNDLTKDVKRHGLVSHNGKNIIEARATTVPGFFGVRVQKDGLKSILDEFPDITVPNYKSKETPSHRVRHYKKKTVLLLAPNFADLMPRNS